MSSIDKEYLRDTIGNNESIVPTLDRSAPFETGKFLAIADFGAVEDDNKRMDLTRWRLRREEESFIVFDGDAEKKLPQDWHLLIHIDKIRISDLVLGEAVVIIYVTKQKLFHFVSESYVEIEIEKGKIDAKLVLTSRIDVVTSLSLYIMEQAYLPSVVAD